MKNLKFTNLLLLALSLLLIVSCGKFDDSALWQAINKHTEEIAALKEKCNTLNSDIESLRRIIDALQSRDYITDCTPLTDGSGYTIVFYSGQSIVIKNGTDGKDGSAPEIGIAQFTDGLYYWTLDEEWLLDKEGDMIRADGKDGKDGQDGKDGITPKLKIEDGDWYISTDNGATWTNLGRATGEDGKDGQDAQSLFKSVTPEEDCVVFELNDGTKLKIPYYDESGDIAITGEYSDLTAYSAMVFGWSNQEEQEGLSAVYGIEYSDTDLTTAPKTVNATLKDQENKFCCELTNLHPNTKYYYRAFTYFNKMYSYGIVKTFTTLDGPDMPEKATMILDPTELNFDATATSQTVQVTCNRDWKVSETDVPEWISLTVDGEDIKGKIQKASPYPVIVTVTVLENTGFKRQANIVFNGGSLAKKTLTVHQDGLPVYHGDGTLEKPYSALDSIEAAGKLADGQEVEVYVKGIISTIKELDTGSFGNATYYISDDGQAAEGKEFYIYRGYYFNGEKFTVADQIKVGDEVVVFGKLINYRGNTPELSQGNKIITLNGQTPEPPKPITGENLLTNPGFEEWSGDAPVAWMEVSSNATIAKETTQVHGGAASISIEGSTSNKRVMSKDYNLKAGTYQLGLYAKGEGQLRIGYALLDAEGKVADTSNDYKYLIDPVVAGTDWTLHSNQFTLDKTTKVSIIIINSSKGGSKSFFADDVTLVTEDGGVDDSGESAISLDKTTLSVAAEAGSQKVNVTSSVAWTATSDAA